MKLVSVIIPCYNEEVVLKILYEKLSAVLTEIVEYNFELLFVNDGSTDKTLGVIKEFAIRDQRISYLDFSRNFGKEAAMIAGIDYANGDAVIIMDADLQHPPELIPQMLAFWQQGYDDVYTRRKSRHDESFVKRNLTGFFYHILQKISKIDVQKNVGDFRLLDRRCIVALRGLRESQRYTKGMFSWIGYKKKELLYDCNPRAAGVTKWNYFSLINLAIEGITSFTTVPLKLASIFGFFISISALFFMFGIILKTLILGDVVQGYPTLITTILFLGGIQLIFLGILGEYIGRIFTESKNRPLYLVNEYYIKQVENEEKNQYDSVY